MSEQAAFEEGVWSSLGGTKSVPARGQRSVDAVVQLVKSYYRQGSEASAVYSVPVSIESDDFRRPPWSRDTLPGFLESWSGHRVRLCMQPERSCNTVRSWSSTALLPIFSSGSRCTEGKSDCPRN